MSPTVAKVLDEFLCALKMDTSINGETVNGLEKLLRTGKVPKPGDIDMALSLPPTENKE